MTERVAAEPGPREPSPSPAVGRLTPALAVAACTLFPVLQVVALAVGPRTQPVLPSVLVTACHLPLFLRIVVLAMRGRRPGQAWWCVGGIAVVAGAAAAIGAPVLPVALALLFGALLLMPSWWALAVVVVLAAAEAPAALAMGAPVSVLLYPTEMLWLYTLVALVATVRRLELARRELADQALLTERLRIDEDLRRSVGVALDDLAARGDRLAGSSREPHEVAAELADLVAAARGSLAEARRIARGYRRAPLQAELEAAVTLLAAAGIHARVVLPEHHPSTAAADALQRDLHTATARLLDGRAGPVVLRVVEERGRLRLVVHDDSTQHADRDRRPASPDDARHPVTP